MRDQPTAEPVNTSLHFAIILVVSSLVMFTNLGGPRLWDRDEPRNAGCALEMMQRGDWVVPFFNAELRAHKPVLLYWLIMSAYGVFGVSEFSARFWSAALAVGTVLATYGIGRRLFDANVGFWAALILATSLMFDVAGRAATPDSALIFCSTAALLVYVLAAFPANGTCFPQRWRAAGAMYGLMGLAVLAKGPVGAVLPTAVIGMFLLIVRLPKTAQGASRPAWQRWLLPLVRPFAPLHFLRTCWSMRPLTAIIVILAVAGPWYAWVGWRTSGEFLRVFFGEHNLGRAAQAMEGHGGGLWFYPVAILVGFFPWSVFAAPVVTDLVARVRQRTPWSAGYVFALCWIGVYVGLFSLAQTKLASYITPCYPALALLTACFVRHWTRGLAVGWRGWPGGAIVTLALVGLVMAVALPLAARRFLPGEEWLGLVGLIPLLGALVAIRFQRRQQFLAGAQTIAITAVAFTATMFGWAVLRVDRHQQNQRLLTMIERAGGNPQIGAFGRLEPTWIFYGGRPIDELTLDAAGAAGGGGPWKPKPRPLAPDFFGPGQDRFIITTDRCWDQLRAALPARAAVLAECPLFLRRERLLLIGVADRANGTFESRTSPPASLIRHVRPARAHTATLSPTAGCSRAPHTTAELTSTARCSEPEICPEKPSGRDGACLSLPPRSDVSTASLPDSHRPAQPWCGPGSGNISDPCQGATGRKKRGLGTPARRPPNAFGSGGEHGSAEDQGDVISPRGCLASRLRLCSANGISRDYSAQRTRSMRRNRWTPGLRQGVIGSHPRRVFSCRR